MVIKVVSNDEEEFEIDDTIAQRLLVLKTYSDGKYFICSIKEGFSGSIPLPNVKGFLLKHIIEFCNHHKNDFQPEPIDEDDDDPNKDNYEPKRTDEISEWNINFIKQFSVQDGTIFDIIMTVNYLGIKSLLSVGCKTVANMVRSKSM